MDSNLNLVIKKLKGGIFTVNTNDKYYDLRKRIKAKSSDC